MDIPEELVLQEVSDDGDWLRLSDGSEWELDPADIPTVILWLPWESIEVSLREPINESYP